MTATLSALPLPTASRAVKGSPRQAAPSSSGRRAASNPSEGEAHSRMRLDEIQVESRSFPARREEQIRFGEAQAVLVVAVEGGGEFVSEAGKVSLTSGVGVFLSRPGSVTAVWRAGSRRLVLNFSRRQLQILASAEYGGGRRLAARAPSVTRLEENDDLMRVLGDCVSLLADAQIQDHAASELERRLGRSLLHALVGSASVSEVLPPSRSVTDAIQRVQAAPDRDWNAAALAMAVGVTTPVLRRNFRNHLGKSIASLILETRLARARESLASARDSRSMAVVAKSVGFGTPNALSRAYVRLFGESPTQTRVKAVRAGDPPKRR